MQLNVGVRSHRASPLGQIARRWRGHCPSSECLGSGRNVERRGPVGHPSPICFPVHNRFPGAEFVPHRGRRVRRSRAP
ncbi:hypothetical protein HMPREF9946_04356 [Acetobacteraceae bacterium AT-5844]|nr:hypothetical protein HMPREF9946_04356 [Acetobacteraceae bacterium AT-5844]